MHIMVKICGLTTVDTVKCAIEAGADAVGFVFAESPRQVTVARATALARAVPPGITRVAVMHHPTRVQWKEVVEEFRPDWLQTDAEDFVNIELTESIWRIPVYRDTADLDLEAIGLEANGKEKLTMFEAATSGVGERADWNKAAGLAKTSRIILAGGLDPDNVGAAIRQVRPWGVDVSSGVEHERGQKDSGRITAFVQAVREAERYYAN